MGDPSGACNPGNIAMSYTSRKSRYATPMGDSLSDLIKCGTSAIGTAIGGATDPYLPEALCRIAQLQALSKDRTPMQALFGKKPTVPVPACVVDAAGQGRHRHGEGDQAAPRACVRQPAPSDGLGRPRRVVRRPDGHRVYAREESVMSPRTKKILMIAGAALGGYIIYSKVIKKPTATAALPVNKATMSLGTIKTAAVSLAVNQIRASTGVGKTALGVLESLGVSESLGSLGGKRR